MSGNVQSAEEKLWRHKVLTAISRIDLRDLMHDIADVLKAPCRNPEYTLDFYRKLNCYKMISPLKLAILFDCTTCLTKLLEAGASADYPRPYGHRRTPLLNVLYYRVHKGDEGVMRILQKMLQHGADANAYYGDLKENVRLSALRMAAEYCFPATVQLLLDYGAKLPFPQPGVLLRENPWLVRLHCDVLKVFLSHAEKYNLDVPLNAIFARVAHKGYYEPWKIARIILRSGYIPDKNAPKGRILFKVAVLENSAQAGKVMFMMLDLQPMMFQVSRDVLLGHVIPQSYVKLFKNPSTLKRLCKGVILSTIGHRYLEKVKQLPLPLQMIKLLDTVKETE